MAALIAGQLADGQALARAIPKAAANAKGTVRPSDMSGAVQLAVLSHAGREAIVGTLSAGDFMGEGVLAGQPVACSLRGRRW